MYVLLKWTFLAQCMTFFYNFEKRQNRPKRTSAGKKKYIDLTAVPCFNPRDWRFFLRGEGIRVWDMEMHLIR